MIGLGQDIIALFAGLGDLGMLIAIAIIIWIDGTAVPTLPEAWMVFIFGAHPDSFWWGVSVVMVASCASLGGNFTLYALVKRVGLPRMVQKAMRGYTRWLVLKDERLLIVNRFAPLIPYTGAFIAVCDWDVRKCAIYVFASAVAKFSAYAVIFWLSFDNLRAEIAPWVSLGIVGAVIAASVAASLIYKRRESARGDVERSR